jgi:hypothetical protein
MPSPHSLEDLSHGLMLPARQVAPIIKEFVAAGTIRQIETDHVLAETEREKGKKALRALASERRAA